VGKLPLLRSLGAFVVSTVILTTCFASVAGASDKTIDFRYPLASITVVHKFVQPETLYSAGHRGVDFKASRGTKVYAIAAGRVTFAGLVANGLHVSIDHGNSVVSSSTYLATKAVRAGQFVTKGQLIGTTSGRSSHSEPNTFHFSIRVSGAYVDPISFLEENTQPRDIYLAPIDEKDTSLLAKIINREKQALSALLASPESLKQLKQQLETAIKKASPKLRSYIDEIVQTMDQMKNLSKNAQFKLQSLEKKLIRQLTRAFVELKKLSYDIALIIKKAIALGIELTTALVEQYIEAITYPYRMALNLFLGALDFHSLMGTMSLKLLKQYVDVELPLLLRAVVIPVSCVAMSCVRAVDMKCNIRGSFTPRSPTQYKGSGNEAFFVSGIKSTNKGESGRFTPPGSFQPRSLGYDSNETNYFSYKGPGQFFNAHDTFEDLKVLAQRMDEQIKEFARKNPGKVLDLISHSLGGAVTGMWLAQHYDPTKNAYPRLGKVLMFAPPLSGTALSTGNDIIQSRRDGNALMDELSRKFDFINATSVKQVAENGELHQNMDSVSATKKVKIYAIRSASDGVVTAASDPVTGVEEVVLNDFEKPTLGNPGSVISSALDFGTSHTDITSDPKSISTAQHILEGSKPPCESISNALQSMTQASFVHASEVTFARNARDTTAVLGAEEKVKYLNILFGK
jgi:hypothetical protein